MNMAQGTRHSQIISGSHGPLLTIFYTFNSQANYVINFEKKKYLINKKNSRPQKKQRIIELTLYILYIYIICISLISCKN